MLKNIFKKHYKFFLLCPVALTGGPEAIHQLHHKIISNGGKSFLVYYDSETIARFASEGGTIVSPQLYSEKADVAKMSEYKKYRPVLGDLTQLDDESLVIFPEGAIAFEEYLPKQYARAIWWLSVDNAILSEPRLKYKSFKFDFLSRKDVIHFYQSEYAKRFLYENGGICFPLFDYTTNYEFYINQITTDKSVGLVSYFPSKGESLANIFFEANPNINNIAIKNMSKSQVLEALSRSAVYIDFGHQPGKDRVPREAASCYAIVFVHKMGAAVNSIDYPLDDFFKFNTQDVHTGDLANRVRYAIDNYDECLKNQAYFRKKIKYEENEFNMQVDAFFINE